jgi:tetratricopeptide (TPR) repeat protein
MNQTESIEDRYHRAVEASDAGQHAKAANILGQLAVEMPDEALFPWRLGYVFSDQGEYGKAINCFQRAIGIDQNCPEAWGGLGQALMELSRWDEAEAALKNRLEMKPAPHYWVFLARAMWEKGDVEGAIQSCKHAVEIDPEYDEAFYNLGVCYSILGRHEESQQAFGRAVELDSTWTGHIEEYKRKQLKREDKEQKTEKGTS